MTASNTHRPSLDRITELTGVGAVIWKKRKHLRSRRHRLSGWWLVNSEAAESVLRQTLPYMVTKREQAELALAFQARLREPAMKADRAWQREWLERMRRLNRRGPAA